MGIKKVGTKWIASYSKRHPDTKVPVTLRRQVNSQSEAKRIYNQIVVDVENKITRTVIPSWSELVKAHISNLHKSDISKNYIQSYELCLKAHTFRKWGDRLIDSITSDEIRNLVRDDLASKSQSQKKHVLKYVRGTFDYAIELGLMTRNPAPKMKFKALSKLNTVLTLLQMKSLLNQARIMNNEWYPIWAMALYTGMRNGELYALTWDKVDLENRKIKVDRSWNKVDEFKSTKSGDDRLIEIAPELLTLLKELKIQNSIYSEFVLPRIEKWKKGEQARELRMFLEGLGIPPVRFHDLRASWATYMLSVGIPPIKVMAMGGWRDISTMQHYIRLAGVNISGITDLLSLDLCSNSGCNILNLSRDND